MDTILIVLTLVSSVTAITTSAVAWRMARRERDRSEARMAALATSIHDERDSGLAPEDDDRTLTSGDAFRNEMFASTPEPEQSRVFAMAAAGALVGTTVVALVLVFGGSASSASAPVLAAAPAAAPAQPGPLELVALGHERDAERLTVRGVLRNPSTGSEVVRLTAVVLLFNHEGRFITSGRAAVDAAAIGPGGETAFSVTVPGAAEVGRYRVSFRTDDGVIPHVDRRT